MKSFLRIFSLIFFVFTSAFIFSACAEKKVSDEQIVKDLAANESVTTIFESYLFETEPFTYFSHRITKRQTNLEKKEDIIYCNLTVNNTHFSVNADCVLNYNYYDEGGWILDKIDISNKKVTPTDTFSNDEILNAIIKAGTKTMAYRSIEEHGEKTGVNVLESEIISENNSYIMRVSLKYKRSLTVSEGYMDITFDNEKGWYWKTGDITPTKIIEADYKKALGAFTIDPGLLELNIFVDSINIEEGYAEIRLQNRWDSSWYKDGKVMKCPFDVYTGTIDVSAVAGQSLFWYSHSFTYDASRNCWD